MYDIVQCDLENDYVRIKFEAPLDIVVLLIRRVAWCGCVNHFNPDIFSTAGELLIELLFQIIRKNFVVIYALTERNRVASYENTFRVFRFFYGDFSAPESVGICCEGASPIWAVKICLKSEYLFFVVFKEAVAVHFLRRVPQTCQSF